MKPPRPTEAQLIWARKQQRIHHREVDETALNESETEYLQRRHIIHTNGFQHDGTAAEIEARRQRQLDMNERYKIRWSERSFGGSNDCTLRFQDAFAAAVCALEQHNTTPHKHTSPIAVVWTPAMRDYVASAAKAVLEADDEVHSFLRHFEEFMVDESSWTWDSPASKVGTALEQDKDDELLVMNGKKIFDANLEPPSTIKTAVSFSGSGLSPNLLSMTLDTGNEDDWGEKYDKKLEKGKEEPRSTTKPAASSAGCGLSPEPGYYLPPDQIGNVRMERQMMP